MLTRIPDLVDLMDKTTISEQTDYEIARVLSEDSPNVVRPSTNWLTRLPSVRSLSDIWAHLTNVIQPISSFFPRVNEVVPVDDEELLTNRADLEEKLSVYGLQEKRMKGDGNCQFTSLSDQLYNSPSHHLEVRQMVVNHLKEHPEFYISYIPGDYEEYLEEMEKEGEWGDHVTLQAAADVLGVRIYVLTSFRNESFIQVEPKERKSERCLYLSFWAEVRNTQNINFANSVFLKVHYNSVYPADDHLSTSWWNWNPFTAIF